MQKLSPLSMFDVLMHDVHELAIIYENAEKLIY